MERDNRINGNYPDDSAITQTVSPTDNGGNRRIDLEDLSTLTLHAGTVTVTLKLNSDSESDNECVTNSPGIDIYLHQKAEKKPAIENTLHDMRAKSPNKRITATTIDDHVLKCGILPHTDGFKYICDALSEALREPSYILTFTKRLYPRVAELNKTTPECVERCIRHAIKIANFTYMFDDWKKKPTSKKLITSLYNDMRKSAIQY